MVDRHKAYNSGIFEEVLYFSSKLLVFLVVCDLKTSRMHLLVDYFHPCNWFYALCYGILSLLIAMCTTKFSTKTYSIYTDCRSTQGTFRCVYILLFKVLVCLLKCLRLCISIDNSFYDLKLALF